MDHEKIDGKLENILGAANPLQVYSESWPGNCIGISVGQDV